MTVNKQPVREYRFLASNWWMLGSLIGLWAFVTEMDIYSVCFFFD